MANTAHRDTFTKPADKTYYVAHKIIAHSEHQITIMNVFETKTFNLLLITFVPFGNSNCATVTTYTWLLFACTLYDEIDRELK